MVDSQISVEIAVRRARELNGERLGIHPRRARRVKTIIDYYGVTGKESYDSIEYVARYGDGGLDSKRGLQWLAMKYGVVSNSLTQDQRKWAGLLGRHLRTAGAAIHLSKAIIRHCQRGYAVRDYWVMELNQLLELLDSPLPPCPICLPEA